MSEEEQVVSNIKTNLTCQICDKLFMDPRILPCLHTFCCLCVETLLRNRPLKDKLLKCPTCQLETGLDSRNSVRKLPANSLLLSLLDLLQIQEGEAVQCDVCDSSEESSADVRCRECSVYLCELHAEAHKRARETTQHVLLSLGKFVILYISSSCHAVLLASECKASVKLKRQRNRLSRAWGNEKSKFPTGFEPMTFWTPVGCSNHRSYRELVVFVVN